MDRIVDPNQYETKELPKEVYEYEEYINLYDYVQEKGT